MKRIINQRFNIGIVLLLLTTSITNLIAYITNKSMYQLSDILLVVSLICLIDFKSLKKLKFYISKLQGVLYIYILILLIFGISSGYSFNSGLGSIIYIIFSLFVMMALFTNEKWNYNSDFPRILFYISGLLCILATFVISDNLTNIYTGINSIYSKEGLLIVNRLTLSTFSLMALITCFCYTSKNKYEFVLKLIFAIFAILLIMIVSRRGSTIELIIGAIVLIIHNLNLKNKKIMKKDIIKFFFMVLIIAVTIIALLHNEDFKKRINIFVNSINKAVITLINDDNKNGRDVAASIRYNNRNATISEFNSFNITEIFLGKGYMSRNQIDFPLLQIFYDCGILMGIIYFILSIVYPLKFVISKPKNDMDKIMIYFAIITICNSFFTGNPYGINCYMYLIIVLFYYFQKKMI